MRMKLDKKTGFLILGAVVVLALIVIVYGYSHSLSPTLHLGNGTPVNPPGPAPTYAPVGQVTAGFPQELILDNAAKFSNSYSVNYSATVNQYTAVWTSNSAMATLFASYKNYFTQNGWTITNTFTGRPTLRGVYATKGTASANVGIVAQGNGSQVTITYLMK